MPHKRRSLGQRARFAVLAAGGFRCRYCGKRPPEAVLQVDHVVPLSRGGTNAMENLVASCTACNLGKPDATLPGPVRVRWEPLSTEPGHPLRCRDERHPGPWEEVLYLPPEVGPSAALVCPACSFIVAVRVP